MTADTSYRRLKDYCYFSSLSDSALESISKKLETVQFPAGAKIITEGEDADAFYLVSSGNVEVSRMTQTGEMEVLSAKSKGDGFGEMALLTCSPRIATVTAKTDVTLLKLLKTDFEEIVRVDTEFSDAVREKVHDYEQFNQLKSLSPFTHLESEKITLLFEKMKEQTYPPGENIINQGEKGDVYHIIKSGRVSVHKQMMKDEPEKVAVLGSGEAFGEEALITDSPRNATVTTEEETTVWTLSKPDFDEIMKSFFLDEVSSDDALNDREKVPFLDVRMQMEYDEEHIPDSINIPLDELRKRYSELDKNKEYYVYCLMGARSSSATFLLQTQGFRAKSIEGGILNWPGPVVEGEVGGVSDPFMPK
jgi:CRP-like cAMP-binding protein/rhodanese-related sulfurtransferase